MYTLGCSLKKLAALRPSLVDYKWTTFFMISTWVGYMLGLYGSYRDVVTDSCDLMQFGMTLATRKPLVAALIGMQKFPFVFQNPDTSTSLPLGIAQTLFARLFGRFAGLRVVTVVEDLGNTQVFSHAFEYSMWVENGQRELLQLRTHLERIALSYRNLEEKVIVFFQIVFLLLVPSFLSSVYHTLRNLLPSRPTSRKYVPASVDRPATSHVR